MARSVRFPVREPDQTLRHDVVLRDDRTLLALSSVMGRSRALDLHEIDLVSGRCTSHALDAVAAEMKRDRMWPCSLSTSPRGHVVVGSTGISILSRDTARISDEFRCAAYVIDPQRDAVLRVWPQLGGCLRWHGDTLYGATRHSDGGAPIDGESFDALLRSVGARPDPIAPAGDGVFMRFVFQSAAHRINGMGYPAYVDDEDPPGFAETHRDRLAALGLTLSPGTESLQRFDAFHVLDDGALLVSMGQWFKSSTLERYHLLLDPEGVPRARLEDAGHPQSQVVPDGSGRLLYVAPDRLAIYDRRGQLVAELDVPPNPSAALGKRRIRVGGCASDGAVVFVATDRASKRMQNTAFVTQVTSGSELEQAFAAHAAWVRKN